MVSRLTSSTGRYLDVPVTTSVTTHLLKPYGGCGILISGISVLRLGEGQGIIIHRVLATQLGGGLWVVG